MKGRGFFSGFFLIKEMNRILLLSVIILALVACTQSNNVQVTKFDAKETSQRTDTLCFNRYSGLKNQDTAFIKLIIEGDKVRGYFRNIPYEKDSRKGIVSGVKTGNHIKGMWHYQQEGVADSIAYEFKLHDTKLFQKETSYDATSGREFLSDSAKFNVEFSKGDCQPIN